MSEKYTTLKIVGKSYQTLDGKFHTKASSSDFIYWFSEDNIKQGSTSYDYLFFLGKEGIASALEVLNRVKD